jgi:signal transduction histidine kinase
MELEDLPPIDFCVLSHYHGDHFDHVVEERLQKDLPIITTEHATTDLKDKGFTAALSLDTWDSVTVSKGDATVRVTSMPGKHGPALTDLLLPPVMGSMLEFQPAPERTALRLYITGDTLVHDDLHEIPRRYPDIDLALFHLGGTRILGILLTMDAEQGVEAIRIINPREVIPIHYNDYEVFKSPLQDFKRAVEVAGFESRVRYLSHGETYSLRSQRAGCGQLRIPVGRIVLRGTLASIQAVNCIVSRPRRASPRLTARALIPQRRPLGRGHRRRAHEHPEFVDFPEYLRRAHGEAKRAAEIVDRLLDYIRERTPTFDAVDVRRVVADAVAIVTAAAGARGAQIAEVSDDAPVVVRADAIMLRQVVLNLVNNALDAVDGAGQITVRTRTERDGIAGTRAVVSVSDTGRGVPGEHLPHIFEPFFTTKEVGRGVGLGLAICQSFVEQHGGTIRADSAGAGGGTTVEFELPLES